MEHYGALQSRYEMLWSVMEHYGTLRERHEAVTLHQLCPYGTECTHPLHVADEFSYSADSTLHPHHFSPLTHRSLTRTFTLNLTLKVVIVWVYQLTSGIKFQDGGRRIFKHRIFNFQ